jgi:FHA domain/Zinc-ribbon containing domain
VNAQTGTFRCTGCGYLVSLTATDAVPECPRCGGGEFARASLFTGSPTLVGEPMAEVEDGGWLAALRDGLHEPGPYLAYRSSPRDLLVAFALRRSWTRIGRSLAADIRFDDPTVSRRHALIVRQPDGLRLLDDRSLNGVFVNGQRVDWSTLADGDQIVIGAHHLHFIVVPVPSSIAGDRREAAEHAPG